MKMFDIFKRFKKAKERCKFTLVLGGGSARGIAHIGVLKVLDKEKIPIDAIVGTSMGALIGAAYSIGIPLSRLEEKAHGFTWDKLFDLTFPKMAIVEGKKLMLAIEETLEGKGFQDVRIPLTIVTTDIEKNEEVAYTSGDLAKIVRASCSWPGIFNPVEIDGRLLVDGGVKNSVPTKAAKRQGAEYIIASDVGFCVKHGKIENIFQMLLQSFQIMGEELNHYQSIAADVVIKPMLGDIDQSAFNRSREAIRIGEHAAEEKIAEIKTRLWIHDGR